MTKLRILVFLLTIVVVGLFGSLFAYYARGYRFDRETFKLVPNGILVLRSDPDAAQVFIDGELKTATNTTLSLTPGSYKILVKKDGYTSWEKELLITKEVVTEADVALFRSAPSLSPVTFNPSLNPVTTDDYTKVAYYVPVNPKEPEKSGLWVIETINLPIGFSRDPRRVTDGDLSTSIYEFSPDGRQILITNTLGIFLIDTSTFTPQAQFVNLTPVRKEEILLTWKDERAKKLTAQMRNLPEGLTQMLTTNAINVLFSPDESKILYTASTSAELKDKLISPLPGSSTQKEERSIKEGKIYIYDIKEDRNFLISDLDAKKDPSFSLKWFPTSRHVLVTEKDKVNILDYDGTNKQTVYSGVYSAPQAYPFVNTSRILILTNLGANSNPPNLYSLTVK